LLPEKLQPCHDGSPSHQ
jgi:hypothetical protein